MDKRTILADMDSKEIRFKNYYQTQTEMLVTMIKLWEDFTTDSIQRDRNNAKEEKRLAQKQKV
ncbi:MAG: hypothetical protein CM15mV82_480 [uncultured marine virus]|nr:MAG: hypothetical protein CM15mV82_480 [uncultured marine virus]